MEHTIRIYPEGKTIAVPSGVTLLDAMRAAGLPVDAPCGGRGTCGKCAVEWRLPGETAFARALACRTRVECDMEIRLSDAESALQVLLDGRGIAAGDLRPIARVLRLQVEPCPRGQSVPDWTRLCAALDGALGPRNWQPSTRVCRGLGALLQKTRGRVWAVACGDAVLEVSEREPAAYMAAFDLGTTTIAGFLMDAAGNTLARRGVGNPQARYGADVIARANHALNHGVDALSDCVRRALDNLLKALCHEANVAPERVCAVMLAGNTAMHHLFLGISPDSLVRAPYNPVVGEPLTLPASEYGFHIHPEARLYALPVIGGFVGADTVACLVSGDWTRRERMTLMIDIGTNGELVLGNRRRRLACSTAAGPALEGAKISCGMRAASGAVDRVWLTDGHLKWHVIGDVPARGLCGSGLVDLIAALLETGDIDGSGRLAKGDRYALGDTGVALTQKDVREVQLAKAAIAAGIRLMCKHLDIALEQIEEVDIAGAFGNVLNPDSACAIGLIPAQLRQKIVPVGNAAGEGARLALLDEKRWGQAQRLARETEFIELATLPTFQDEFVDRMAFSDDDDD